VHRGAVGDERLEARVLQAEPLAIAIASWSEPIRPLLEQDLAHRVSGGARLADNVLDGVAVAEAEADDDVAEQPAGTGASGGLGRHAGRIVRPCANVDLDRGPGVPPDEEPNRAYGVPPIR
jgi:hypothetical protein